MTFLQAASAEGDSGGFFVNLTTENPQSAITALDHAQNHIRKRDGVPVTVWLNARGVHLAQALRNGRAGTDDRDQGASIQSRLRALMDSGGKVKLCTACVEAAGIPQHEFMAGVTIGHWSDFEDMLLDLRNTVVAW